jgi:hypothetical protein
MRATLEQDVAADAVGKALGWARALAKAAVPTVVRLRAIRVGGAPMSPEAPPRSRVCLDFGGAVD